MLLAGVLVACLCLLDDAAYGLSPDGRAKGAALSLSFVRLSDVAPSILQDVRYASSRNVLGRPLNGYMAPVCLLRRSAAEALARVQAALKPEGLGLLVFDCYRPSSAVDDLVAYVEKRGGRLTSPYHPNVSRRDLITRGYIGRRSLHSSGLAVDLTLVVLEPNQRTASPMAIGPCPIQDHPLALPMGTAFDCFDIAARHKAAVGPEVMTNREKLTEAMAAQGFRPYAGEWWHFTFPAVGPDDVRAHNFRVR